ncbi:PAS domain-containing protein [Geomicrobium sp. JCM 19055]|uniref:PAS domain-containing protein n=1 Tax=Geomicrobium sp. JCM 19055 TaxID=1460649 RepID=UPI00045ED8E7|nr:PAS domain-containing protein [Geomicrobium sp. JCM 19055]GAJ98153.1 two-component sensor histidine kinase [Geomicrobium sp. JCM 19055]
MKKTDELEGQIERIRLQVQHPFVSVVNVDGKYLHKTNATSGGEDAPEARYSRTLMYGSYQSDSDQLHIQIIAPIYQQVEFNGERLVGAVKVEYPRDILMTSITDKFMRLGFVAIVSLIILVLGISLLARNIREDTFGLEPAEIASKFTEREAMLESVKEGIIAINTKQEVTLINPSARKLIQHPDDEDKLVRDLGLLDVINGEAYLYDEERFFQRTPSDCEFAPDVHEYAINGCHLQFSL